MNPLNPSATPIDPSRQPSTRTTGGGAPSGEGGFAPPTIRTSLDRLSRALTVRGSDTAEVSAGARAAAAASLRPTTGASAVQAAASGDRGAALTRLRSLLSDLETLVASTPAGRDEAALAATQAEIDRVLADVERVAGGGSLAQAVRGAGSGPRGAVSVTAVSSAVVDVDVLKADLAYRERRDVDLRITRPAEAAALFLDFSGAEATDRTLTLTVTGVEGLEVLTFLSGTSISEIVSTVNQVTDETDVQALVNSGSPPGFFMISSGFSQEHFVTVRVQQYSHPPVVDPRTIRSVSVDEGGRPVIGDVLSTFDEAAHRVVRDLGVNLGLEVRGFNVEWVYENRAEIRSDDGRVDVEFELVREADALFSLGHSLPFDSVSRAFSLIGGAATGAQELPGGAQPVAALGATPSADAPIGSFPGANITVNSLNPAFESARVKSANLAYQERADVYANVVRYEEAASLYLDFDASFIDLDTGGVFEFEIGGNEGVKAFSMASGTAITNIVDAVNAFTPATGVRAILSGSPPSGILLASDGFGADEFVSVRVLQTGGGPNAARSVRAISFDDDGDAVVGEEVANFSQIQTTAAIDRGADLRLNFGGTEADYPGGVGGSSTDQPVLINFELRADLVDGPAGLTQRLAGLKKETFLAFTAIGGATSGADEGPDGEPIGGDGDLGQGAPPPPTGALPPPTFDSLLRAVRPFATGGALSLAARADPTQRVGALHDALAILDTIGRPAPVAPGRVDLKA